MSTDKTAGRRKAGEPVRRRPKPRLRLPKPQSECSTPELASELSQELVAALRRLSRRREPGDGDDPPEAA